VKAARTEVLKRATSLGSVRGSRRWKRRARRTEANRATRRCVRGDWEGPVWHTDLEAVLGKTHRTEF